ncbi:MAG: TetR/AcrR family transcriptional regulator [Syntrophales bacterium]|nr:TetR/AcrR family transcriptional regulator [Syntrophales bacterium]
MESRTDNTRERIIEAAERVIIESGARRLTLEVVASKAGISRGGLLYHFPDKESLLGGMMDKRRKHLFECRVKRLAAAPAGLEREAVAYVLSLLDDDVGRNRNVAAALIASGAHDPELLTPVREDHRQVINDLTRDGLSRERAAVITLAANGLRLWEVLSMSPFNTGERGKIVEELLALAEESKGA